MLRIQKGKGEESIEWVRGSCRVRNIVRERERGRLWGLKIFNGIIGKVFNVGRIFKDGFKVKECWRLWFRVGWYDCVTLFLKYIFNKLTSWKASHFTKMS